MNERIEIGGRKFYWDDIYQFMEWFVRATGPQAKQIMDGLMSKQWGLAEVGDLEDSVIGNIEDVIHHLEEENVKLGKERDRLLTKVKNMQVMLNEQKDVEIIEDRLLEAERLLSRIGMSLNYQSMKDE